MKKSYLVVTVTCPDRPGVVERITAVLTECSANWEESRMARLGGEFAGIVKISVADTQVQALVDALRALNNEQMTVVVKTTEVAAPEPVAASSLYKLRLAGGDHDGIVHTVAAYLVEQGINVESMDTEVVPAPVTATPLFQMEAIIRVPTRLAPDTLQANLSRIGDELAVDIEIHPQDAT